jgi:hypothetical protein
VSKLTLGSRCYVTALVEAANWASPVPRVSLALGTTSVARATGNCILLRFGLRHEHIIRRPQLSDDEEPLIDYRQPLIDVAE